MANWYKWDDQKKPKGEKYNIVKADGLPVTSEARPDSCEIARLPRGTEVMVMEEAPKPIDADGKVRARIQCGPIKGWLTLRTAKQEFALPDDDDDSDDDDQGGGGKGSWGNDGDWGGYSKKPTLKLKKVQARIAQLNKTVFTENPIDWQCSHAIEAVGEQAAMLYLVDLEAKAEQVTQPSNYLKSALRKIGIDPKNPDSSTMTGTHPKLVKEWGWNAGSTGGQKREGDWECKTCGANVFAHKLDCFRCGAPRTDMGSNSQKTKTDESIDEVWDTTKQLLEKYPHRAAYGEDEIRQASEMRIISQVFISERVEEGVIGGLVKAWMEQMKGRGVMRVVRRGNRCYDEINKWSAVAQIRQGLEGGGSRSHDGPRDRQGRPY